MLDPSRAQLDLSFGGEIAGAVDEPGGGPEVLMNPDLRHRPAEITSATGAMAAVEEARAALAEDLNLNTRLVLEQAFLRLARAS